MLALIDNPNQTNKISFTQISSNIQNKLSEKVLASSLAISFAFCPTCTSYAQNIINAKAINIKYDEHINNGTNDIITSVNKFMINGNDIEDDSEHDYNVVKLSYNNGINLSELSYNTIIRLNEYGKDVNSMLSKDVYKIKGRITKAYTDTNIIKNFSQDESIEIEKINTKSEKKIKLKGRVKSVKNANELLV